MSARLTRYSRPTATAMAVLLFTIAAGRVSDTKQTFPSYDDEHIPLTLLSRWWCWGSSLGVDHITAIVSQDFSSPTCLLEGAIAYTLTDPVNRPFGGSAAPMYRLYASSVDNHMDSGATSEGGYSLDASLGGSVWSTAGPGMVALTRYYGLTQPDDQPTGLSTDSAQFTAWGYGAVGNYGFVYPRYGNQYQVYVTVPTSYEGSNPATVADHMVLKSNKAAGGIVSQVWYNGFQFLNNFDFAGRQLQHGLFKTTSWGAIDNPTEGGDKWGGPAACNGGAPPNALRHCGQSHGSPLLQFVASGNSLQTEVHPLDYVPERVSPLGDIDHPVMWSGKLRKVVTTNFLNDPQIAQWKSFVTVPKLTSNMGDYGPIGGHFMDTLSQYWYDDVSIGTDENSPNWATGLINFTDRFNESRLAIDILPNSWCVDALEQQRQQHLLEHPEDTGYVPHDPCEQDPKATEYGMIMLSTPDGTKAIGLYYHSNHPGGAKFGAVKVSCSLPLTGNCALGPATGEFAFATNIMRVGHIYWGNDVPAGEYPKSETTSNYYAQPYNTWVSYVIVGDSVNEVRTKARWLKGQCAATPSPCS